jgi:hypothetical protein
LLGVAGLGLAVALAGCSKSPEVERPTIPASFVVRGDVRLSGPNNVTGDLSNCAGVGPYADLYKGANVVVTNQKGRPIARGTITDGLGTNYFEETLDECALRIRVPVVPRAKGYFFVLGRQAPHPITLAEMVAGNGSVRFDANPPIVRSFGSP